MNNKRGKRGKGVQRRLVREPRERSLYPAGHIANKSDHDIAHRAGSSITAVVAEQGKYNDHYTAVETVEDHIIPRESLTNQQFLSLKPQLVEVEPVPSRQLDKVSGNMVNVSDNRLVWKSDKTLLNRSKPGAEIGKFKRQGSVSNGQNTRKTLTTENCNTGGNDAPFKDVVLGPAIEDLGDLDV